MGLETVISRLGGASNAARLIGVQRSAVSMWLLRRRIPAKHVPAVARLAGVSRHDLRPDLWEASETPPVPDAESSAHDEREAERRDTGVAGSNSRATERAAA